MADQKFGIDIVTNAKGDGAAKTTAELKGLSSVVSGLGAELAAGLSLVAVTGFLKASASAAAESEEAALKLNTALAATGQLSAAASRSIQDLATEYQGFTNVSDETWTEAAAKLIQFGAEAEKIPEYFPIIEGLAGRMGGSIPAAAEGFARALNGNVRLLAQFGLKLDENATKQERLDAIMRVAATGQGLLRARSELLEGRMKSLSIAAGDFQEALGLVITAGRTGEHILQGLTFIVQKLTGVLPETKDKTLELARAQARLGVDGMASADALGDVDTAAQGAGPSMQTAAGGAAALKGQLKGVAEAADEAEKRLQNIDALQKGIAGEGLNAEQRGNQLAADASGKAGAFREDYQTATGGAVPEGATPAELAQQIGASNLADDFKESLLQRLKDQVEAEKKLQQFINETNKREIQGQIEVAEGEVAGAKEGSKEWRENIKKIARLKGEMIDLDAEREALENGALPNDPARVTARKKQVEKAAGKTLSEADQAEQEEYARTHSSKESERPERRQRGGRTTRGAKRSAADSDGRESTDEFFARSKQAADTTGQAATLHKEAADTFATAAQTLQAAGGMMVGNVGGILGVVTALQSAVTAQSQAIKTLQSQIKNTRTDY